MADDEQGLAGRVFGRLVGGVVAPVVDNVDVEQIVEQVDVDELIQRADVDALLDRVDVDRLLDRIDVNRLLDRVDPDRLLDRVDPDRLLDRVDPDRLLDRVDPDRLVGRVDVDALVRRVDVNGLVDRVDPDRLLDRVDVNAVVERTELGAIITRSTTGVFAGLLDVARTHLMSLDQVAQGTVGRLMGRPARTMPAAPDGSRAAVVIDRSERLSLEDRAVALQHRPAGSVSRFAAFLVDQVIIGMLFAVFTFLAVAALRVVIGYEFDPDEANVALAAAFGLWSFVYVAGSLAASGQTIGKAILGVKVCRADGTGITGRAAALRTIAFPVSFLLFGVGFVLGLLRADRRQLHDLIAGTAVIYAWDAETTRRRARALSDDPLA